MSLRKVVALAVASLVHAAVLSQGLPAGGIEFSAGSTSVRRWEVAGSPRAAWSHDGGDSWRQLLPPDDHLHFVLAAFDPILDPRTFDDVLGELAGNRLFVVQFQTQILPAYGDAVRAVGAEVLHYMPANALFVRCDAAVAAELGALPCVRWVGPLQNAFKLDPALRAFVAGDSTDDVECNLVLAAKSDRAALVEHIIQVGGDVTNRCDGSVMMQAKLSRAQLVAVLTSDLVTWVDLAGPDGIDMDLVRILGGVDQVEAAAGYRGQGVRLEVTEGFDETHGDLVGRVTVRGTNTFSMHGHCTAGIAGGSGAGNPAAKGMMPDCDIVEGAYSSSSHYTQIQDSVNPALPWRTMIATASWGAATTTAYNAISQAMDDALFDSDLTRTNSQGNASSQVSRPEAWAKNIISVGGIKHLNDLSPANDRWNQVGDPDAASIGPAADGRLKPDISGIYDAVHTTDLPGALGYTTDDYHPWFGGTSAAAPIVAGHVGLMQQMFTDGLFGNPLPLPATDANRFANKPHMTTCKALLCNTARQYWFTGTASDLTRTHQGWGQPDLARVYDNRQRIVVLDEYDTLQLGQAREYWVFVPPGTPEFRATMVYADPEAQANASVHLVNDANLKVTRDADGTSWWGNEGLAAGTASVSGGAPNNRDNIECVYLQSPAPGAYVVHVEATSIVQDGKVETPQVDMDFSLVMHPVAGQRDKSGIVLDLVSTGPNNLSLQCSNVPATGWTEGYTAFSFAVNRGLGFGNFFGLEVDGITGALWSSPANIGNPFHFLDGGAGNYPRTAFQFDPALVSLLASLHVQMDAVLVLWNGADIAFVSNVDRIEVQ